MPVNRSAVLLVAALAAVACAPKTVPYDPFKVPRDRFYGSLHTVAVAPMRAPKDLENAEAVKGRFTDAVVARLRAAGLKVVPPEDVGPLVDAAIAAQGGLYDPATGNVIEEKAKAAKVAAAAALKEKYGADALLRVDLRVVMARLDHDVAYWDGVSEKAGTGFWKALFVGSHSGRIPALSVVVFLTAADGTDLYANAGGLRIIGRVNASGQQENIPQAELFGEEAVNARALGIALDPLLGATPPAPGGGDTRS